MRNLTTRLKNKIIVYAKKSALNEVLETVFKFDVYKSVYGEISNLNGSNNTTIGNVTQYNTTHRIILRDSNNDITSDMYFMHKGVRYDIEYINPAFNNTGFIEFLVKRVES